MHRIWHGPVRSYTISIATTTSYDTISWYSMMSQPCGCAYKERPRSCDACPPIIGCVCSQWYINLKNKNCLLVRTERERTDEWGRRRLLAWWLGGWLNLSLRELIYLCGRLAWATLMYYISRSLRFRASEWVVVVVVVVGWCSSTTTSMHSFLYIY